MVKDYLRYTKFNARFRLTHKKAMEYYRFIQNSWERKNEGYEFYYAML